MKLKLESQYLPDSKEVISKTSVENTSNKPIIISHAIIFTINETKTTRQNVMEELQTKLTKNNPSFRTKVLFDLYETDILRGNKNIIQEKDYSIEWLPYYSKDNIRLGPLEVLSTTHSQKIDSPGTYSIYFCIFGENLVKGDASHFRVVHDKIVVTS